MAANIDRPLPTYWKIEEPLLKLRKTAMIEITIQTRSPVLTEQQQQVGIEAFDSEGIGEK
jgi:hypothetical protein